MLFRSRCGKADNLHSPDGVCPPQEPKAQGWMRRVVSEWFGTVRDYNSREKQLLTLIAANAPDVTALVEAAEKMESKIAEIENSEEYKSVWQLAYLHGHRYAGPNYALEVRALRTAISAVKKVRS